MTTGRAVPGLCVETGVTLWENPGYLGPSLEKPHPWLELAALVPALCEALAASCPTLQEGTMGTLAASHCETAAGPAAPEGSRSPQDRRV